MPSSPDAAPRQTAVDIARGLALISMFVAHAAPTGGPGGVLNLSEFLTAALFAMLVGCGVELSLRRHPPGRFVTATVIRACVLIAVDLALMPLGAQVVLVLAHLGVLMLVLLPLAGRSGRLLAGVAVAAALLAPVADGVGGWGTGWPYRIATMVTWGCIGLLAARRLDADRRWFASILLACVAVAGALLLNKRLGWLEFAPYDGSPQETLLNGALALGVLCFCVLMPWPARLSSWLVAMGQMTLTLYAAQIAFLAWVVGPAGRATDDGWDVLAALVVGSAMFAVAWRWLLPNVRGPLEWITQQAVRFGERVGQAERRRCPRASGLGRGR